MNITTIEWSDDLKMTIYELRRKYRDKLQGTTKQLLEVQQEFRNDIIYKKNPDIFAIAICLLLDEQEIYKCNSWNDIDKYFQTMYKNKTYDVSLNTINDIELFHSIFDEKNSCVCNKSCKVSNMFSISHNKASLVVGCDCIKKLHIDIGKECEKKKKEYKKYCNERSRMLRQKIGFFISMSEDKYKKSIQNVMCKAFKKWKGTRCKDCKKQCSYDRCWTCKLKFEGKTYCDCGRLYTYRNTKYTQCYLCNKSKST
jgi:hypothetical protein